MESAATELSSLDTMFKNMLLREIDEENCRQEQLRLLVDLFVGHLCRGETIHDFISFLQSEASEYLQKTLGVLSNEPLYQTLSETKQYTLQKAKQRDLYKGLFRSMNQLYNLLKDALVLTADQFQIWYPNLPPDSYKYLQMSADTITREDYFYMASIKFAYTLIRRGYSEHDLVHTIVQCSSRADDLDPKILSASHPLYIQIEDSLRKRNSEIRIGTEMQANIVAMLKVYFAPQNPFKRQVQLLNAQESVELSADERRKQCTLRVKNICDRIGSSINVSNGPPNMTVSAVLCSRSSKSTNSSNSQLREVLRPIVAMMKRDQISKVQVIEILQRKKIVFSNIADRFICSSSVRGFTAAFNNSNQILFAGVLTCVLHAVRLLYLTEAIESRSEQSKELQKLLSKLVAENMSSPVSEILPLLKLDNVLHAQQPLSFASFVSRFLLSQHGIPFLDLGSIDVSGTKDTESLETQVSRLYKETIKVSRTKDPVSLEKQVQISLEEEEVIRLDKQDRVVEKPLCFISVTSAPKEKITIPSLFRIQYEPENVRFTFQTAGVVFETASSYDFNILTYSSCRFDGQYEVIKYNPVASPSAVHRFLIPYQPSKPYKGIDMDPVNSKIVGLILVDNSHHYAGGKPDDQYLIPERLRCISNGTNLSPFSKDSTDITCVDLHILNDDKGWLGDSLVSSLIYLVHKYFEDLHGKKKILIRQSIAYENTFVKRSRSIRTSIVDGIDHVIIPINLGNTHWICSYISHKQRCIYLTDSLNAPVNMMPKGEEMAAFFKDKYNLVYEIVTLPSSSQHDGHNCGLFTVLNATLFMKTIFEEGNEDSLFTKEDISVKFAEWGEKRFTDNELVQIRRRMKNIVNEEEDVKELVFALDI